MLTLDNLKHLRVARDITRPTLALTTSIQIERLKALELRTAEPWLDEALILSRALCTVGVLPLLGSDTLARIVLPLDFPNGYSLAMWRAGARLPLSVALDLCRRFGLSDPEALHITPHQRQVWSVLSATERLNDRGGCCAWCLADIVGGQDHATTCLPHNLYGLRGDTPQALADVRRLTPESKRDRYRGKGQKAYNLKHLRDNTVPYRRQLDVARLLDINVNHYARLERGELNLTLELAAKLARHYNVTVDQVYGQHPGVSEPVGLSNTKTSQTTTL